MYFPKLSKAFSFTIFPTIHFISTSFYCFCSILEKFSTILQQFLLLVTFLQFFCTHHLKINVRTTSKTSILKAKTGLYTQIEGEACGVTASHGILRATLDVAVCQSCIFGRVDLETVYIHGVYTVLCLRSV